MLLREESGFQLPLLSGATVPDDGRHLHNQHLIADRLSARGVECGAEDLDYELVVGSRYNEYVIKVAARLAQDVGEELKSVVGDVASSRKVPFQMDDIGGYTFKPPDGTPQIDIELLPLGGIAVEPVVFVGGVLLVSHEHNGRRLHKFQVGVLNNNVASLAARMIETEIRAGECAEARIKDAKLAREDRSAAKQQADKLTTVGRKLKLPRRWRWHQRTTLR
jgi:hypothetical protein